MAGRTTKRSHNAHTNAHTFRSYRDQTRGLLLPYVQTTAPNPGDQLFPKLTPGGADGKRGHAFSKWWTRYRREIGVYEPALDYHSFRHGVTTKLYAAEVMDVFVDELTGHEGKGTSRAVYTKAMPLRKLFDAISKVDWPEVAVSGGNA